MQDFAARFRPTQTASAPMTYVIQVLNRESTFEEAILASGNASETSMLFLRVCVRGGQSQYKRLSVWTPWRGEEKTFWNS